MLIWIIESTLAAAILAGIAWAFSRRFHHMPALLHLAWFAVMVRLIMPPLPLELPFSQVLQGWGHQSVVWISSAFEQPNHNASQVGLEHTPFLISQNPSNPTLSGSSNSETEKPPKATVVESSQPADHQDLVPLLEKQNTTLSQPFSLFQDAFSLPSQTLFIQSLRTWPWTILLLGIWIFGSLFLLIRNSSRMLAMRKHLAQAPFGDIALINHVTSQAKKMGLDPPAVVTQEHIATPFVWCFGKPILVWPAKLLPWRENLGQTEILIHELAHIKRRDHWFIWANFFIGALFWWHPLLWIARARMHYYAELACDATVINQTPHSRESYARALVTAMAQHSLFKPRVGALAWGPSKKKAFEKRLAAIMNKNTTLKKPIWALTVLAMAGLFVLPAFKPRPLTPPPVPSSQDIADGLDFLEQGLRDKVQARTLYQTAKRYVRAKEWRRAETTLEESLQLNPNDSHVWSKYGEVLLQLNKFKAAISAFEEYNALGGHSHGDLRIAKALTKSNQLGEAMRILERLGRQGELDPESLGDLEFQALANKASFAQLTLRSAQFQKQSNRARKAMNDKDYRKASELFQGLTKIAPESSWAWDRWCYVLLPLKEFAQAENAVQQAIKLSPEKPHLYYNQACIRALSGKTAQAISTFEKALAMGFDNYDLIRTDPDLDPIRNNTTFRNIVSELEQEKAIGRQIKDLEEEGAYPNLIDALESAERLKTLDQKDRAYIYNLRGIANLRLERFEESEAAFAREIAYSKPHKMRNPLYNLACALAGQGRTQEALASLKASIAVGYKNYHHMEKDPDLALLHDNPGFLELVEQAARERILKRYNQPDWASFETWLDQQLEENAFSRKKLAKLSRNLYNAKAWPQAGKAYAYLTNLDSDDHIPYNAACSYALAGDTELAFYWLEKAVTAGFTNKRHMNRDKDLISLRSDARWQTIQDML